jgi:hypothetical protein
MSRSGPAFDEEVGPSLEGIAGSPLAHTRVRHEREGFMATSKDFTVDEWKNVAAAPFLAGLVVTMSDLSGPVGVTKEAVAVGKVITESATGSSSELIRSLAETFKSGTRPEMPEVPKDRHQVRSLLVNKCSLAVAAVAAKSPAEAQEFKMWLMSIARKAADAAKEGGFLGFGGTQVSASEQTALTELGSALGVTA